MTMIVMHISYLYYVASHTFEVFRPFSSVYKYISTNAFLFTTLCQHVQ